MDNRNDQIIDRLKTYVKNMDPGGLQVLQT